MKYKIDNPSTILLVVAIAVYFTMRSQNEKTEIKPVPTIQSDYEKGVAAASAASAKLWDQLAWIRSIWANLGTIHSAPKDGVPYVYFVPKAFKVTEGKKIFGIFGSEQNVDHSVELALSPLEKNKLEEVLKSRSEIKWAYIGLATDNNGKIKYDSLGNPFQLYALKP